MRPLIVALLAAGLPTAGAAAAVNPRPFTIPALREWKGGHGSFVMPKRPRIVAPRRLNGIARTLAGELHGSVARKGDIELALAPTGHGREAYRLHVGRTIRITASTSTGVFWGTRTVLQLARSSRHIPRGSATDWPRYPDRGLMIDNGRKYFTPKWIAREIRRLAYLK